PEIAVWLRVDALRPARLRADLPSRKAGHSDIHRARRYVHHAANSPIDHDVVAGCDARAFLGKVLLDARDRREAPFVAVAAGIEHATQGIDQRPEARAAIVVDARRESSRQAPDSELHLIVERNALAVESHRCEQDVAKPEARIHIASRGLQISSTEGNTRKRTVAHAEKLTVRDPDEHADVRVA